MARARDDRLPLVTMYSRRRCGLCDAARDVILGALSEVEFEFEELFIDENDDLEGRYGLRVPVVLVDGDERFETEVDGAELRATLRN
ncbi:MAG: glutaredoxin family protein [Actinomycetota bacterium]